jgi:hypothetical protein
MIEKAAVHYMFLIKDPASVIPHQSFRGPVLSDVITP